jgi:hypothetical protein
MKIKQTNIDLLSKKEKIQRAKRRIENILLTEHNALVNLKEQVENIVHNNPAGLTPEEVLGAFDDPEDLTIIKDKVQELIDFLEIED